MGGEVGGDLDGDREVVRGAPVRLVADVEVDVVVGPRGRLQRDLHCEEAPRAWGAGGGGVTRRGMCCVWAVKKGGATMLGTTPERTPKGTNWTFVTRTWARHWVRRRGAVPFLKG